MAKQCKVFLCSTYEDLKDHRAFVIGELRRGGIHVEPMEEWTADPAEPKKFSPERVEACDVLVLLVAFRRGYVPDGETESITQLEYRHAIEKDIDVLPFLLDDDAPWPRRFDEMRDDPAIGTWRGELQKRHGRESFGLDPTSVKVLPAVLRWIEKQRKSTTTPAPTPAEGGTRDAALAEEKRAYLQRVAESCEWIDLGGLAPQVGGELLRLKIDDIFVHLHAERDVPLADELVREEFRLRRELEQEGAPPEQIEEEIEKLSQRLAERGKREEATATERVEIDDALQQGRIVVLGDPGSGKTTLLRYIARQVARENDDPGLPVPPGLLPVYVRLGEYDRYCHQQEPINLMDYFPKAARTRQLGLSPELLEACAGRGQCLFLLDGLDEIVHPGRRGQIRDRVSELAATHPNCRVVVTSRIVGYREAQLPRGDAGYQHFTLSPFDDEEIRRFAERWYEAVGRTGDVADPERQNARMLFEGIQGNPSVKRLATNPLLLTLIGLMYWREVRLPRRRIELYRSASQMLLSSWLQSHAPEVELSEREATSLLMAVAFQMHATSSAGLITRPELDRLLTQEMQGRGAMPELGAQKAVEQFVCTMGEHVGLLYPRGYDDRNQEVFGFLHLTFEEYFAGRELARRWEQGELNLKHYLHRPRWEEPIRLACAHLSDGDNERLADRFVRQILEAGSPYEKECHRDLLLAARCLGDDAFVYPDVTKRVFDGLDNALPTSIIPLNEQVSVTFDTMGGSRVAPKACKLLLRRLRHEAPHVRSVAAWALGSLGAVAVAAEVLAALLERLDDDNWNVCSAAARALGRLGAASGTPEVLAALLERLGGQASSVRSAAARALGSLGAASGTSAVLEALLERLGDEVPAVRSAAARALGSLGAASGTPEVLAALLERLGDEAWNVRDAAAFALGGLGAAAGTPEVLRALLERLGERAYWVRSAAAWALGHLGAASGTPEVLAALVDRLGDESSDVRYAAATALEDLGAAAGTPEVLAALLDRLGDEDLFVRFAAGEALGRLGAASGTPELQAALLERLGDKDSYVRSAAAEALGRLGAAAGTPEVLAALSERLGEEHAHVRSAAAEALGRLGAAAGTPEVLAALLDRLGDEAWHVRSAAAEALGRLGAAAGTPEVLAALLDRLGDEAWHVRSAAAEALGRVGRPAATKDVLDALARTAYACDARQRGLANAAFRALSALLVYYRAKDAQTE